MTDERPRLRRADAARLEVERDAADAEVRAIEASLRELRARVCDADAITVREAHERKARWEARREAIAATLARAVVARMSERDGDGAIAPGATVSIREVVRDDDGDGDDRDGDDRDGDVRVRVVPAADVALDADDGVLRVSDASPLGRALLGARCGDRVRVQGPAGTAAVYDVTCAEAP